MNERMSIEFDVLGVAGAIRDIGGLVGAVNVLGGAIADVHEQTIRANRESGAIIRSQFAGGGTIREVAQTAGEFRAIGMDAEQVGRIAREFQERLFKDPIAIGAFGRSIVPERLGGGQAAITTLREGIAKLERASTAAERRMLAMKFQLEDLLPLFDIPAEQRGRLREAAERQGEAISPDLRRMRAEADALRERGRIADEQWALRMEKIWRPIANTFRRWDTEGKEFERDPIGTIRSRRQAASGTPPDAQVKATEENTQALRFLQQEIANGGPRAAGAVPAGLRGKALQDALDTHSLRWGAFGLHE